MRWGGEGGGLCWPVWLCATRKEEDGAIVFVQWLSFGFVLFFPNVWRRVGMDWLHCLGSLLYVVNGAHLQTDENVIACFLVCLFVLKKRCKKENSFVSYQVLCN